MRFSVRGLCLRTFLMSGGEKMYNYIGKKIKGLAKFFFILATIIDIIVGIVLIAIDDYLIAVGLPIMLIGPVLAWISSWLLYGFGQLIDNSDKLVKSLCITDGVKTKSQTNQSKNNITPETPAVIGNCELCGKKDVPIRRLEATFQDLRSAQLK